MNVKKTLAASTAALVLIGSVLPASAAGIDAGYVKALRENGTADLILNVDAYRAAYPDLDAAFGDDTNAYIMHYLTAGMYEGRTMASSSARLLTQKPTATLKKPLATTCPQL